MKQSPHTYIECECGANVIRVESLLEGEKPEQTFYLDIFDHQNIKPHLITRVKIALKFIFTGKISYSEFFLTVKEAKKLANFINNNTLN